jgi:hypothetical protein
MALPFYIYPRTPTEFKKSFPSHNSKDEIAALLISPKSGSKWTKRHLRALKVLRVAVGGDGILPILKPEIDSARRQLESAKDGEIVRELSQYNRQQVISRPYHDIRLQCRFLSSYYIALAALLEPCDQPATKSPRPTREAMAQTPQKPGYVSGAGIGFSSSPIESSTYGFSSSPYAPSANDPVERSAHEDRVKPEELTTALAHEFLGALCDLTRPVAGGSGIEERLEIYAAPTSYYIPLLNTTSADDGSIVSKGFQAGKWRRLKSTSYCSIEAKRMFSKWEEYEDDEDGMATDREFGQIISELIGSVCQRMEETVSLSEVEKQYVASVSMNFAESTNWITF